MGYFLTGTGDFFPDTNYLGTGPQYLGNDDGSTVLNFFTAAHASFNNTFLLRITAYDGTDTVGIYDHTNPANKTVLFGPGDAVGATKVITISTFFSFGFYGISGDGNTYYSVSDLNPSGETDHQHFALFRDKNNPICWYLGFEDLAGISGTEGYGDYNDMVVQLFCPVPLPGALILLGSGLVGLASYGRRRRKLAA